MKKNNYLFKKLDDNIEKIQTDFENTMDILIRPLEINNIKLAIIMCEGMINLQSFSELVVEPLLKIKKENIMSEDMLFKSLINKNVLSADVAMPKTFEEVYKFIMSGFAVILIENINIGISCGLQGFSIRGISEPETQINIRGAKEGFIEALRINITMIRRRLKTPDLTFELMTIGKLSNTDVALVYMKKIVSKELLKEIKKRISNTKLETLLESGYLQPFLEKKPVSLFSGIGLCERPDSLCAKICEGRVGILVDGTPFALIAPYLFIENFQTMDDYTARPYFATFIRLLKYISFFISVLLPGAYVAVVSYHPELLPPSLLQIIAVSENTTPFPLVYEALIIHFVFEMMREAGLRLPRAVGHAVSIVGALVIGETAV
ncbi:MAG: spore germination protein, partial [Oscillospiraceae bacterium]